MRLCLYHRYLTREVLAAVALVLFAFLAIFTFFDFIEELRRIGHGNYQLEHALLFEVLRLPGLTYELFPIATLIGTLYALSTLARHSEITVLRASGLATRQLLLTLFAIAGVIATLTFLIGEVVVPLSERQAQNLRNRALEQVIAQSGFESGLWVKDGKSFINIRRATPNAPLEGVRIYLFDQNFRLNAVTDAQRATFVDTQHWQLEKVTSTRIENNRAIVEHLDSLPWKSTITPELLSVLTVSPEKMSIFGLISYRQHLSDNHQQTVRYEIALWKKIIYPLSALVMVALALPFAYSHDRVGGVSLKIFLGIMLGIIFYALNGLFSNLGMINAWPPLASAAAPSVLFLLLASAMIWWSERR